MENTTISLLTNHMPVVRRYRSQFVSLNTMLGKTTLTGKISSLDIAENLFEYMENTQVKFSALQNRLINTIMEQSFLNRYEEAQASTKIVADIFSKRLSDRENDVNYLAHNHFLQNTCISIIEGCEIGKKYEDTCIEPIKKLRDFLINFVKNYPIYKDIIIYTTDGEPISSVSLLAKYRTQMPQILEINAESGVQDYFGKIDFYSATNRGEKDIEAILQGERRIDDDNEEEFISKTQSMLMNANEYFITAPIVHNEKILAVLACVVDIRNIFNEISQRFPYRLPRANIVLSDEKNRVIATDGTRYHPIGEYMNLDSRGDYVFFTHRSRVSMTAHTELQSSGAYSGCAREWRVWRILPLSVAFDVKRKEEYEIDQKLLEDSLLITEELDNVILEAENINEDLGDVVINGEIIASKSHSYALNPILNEIRILSEEMNDLCIHSTEDLQRGIYEALFNVVGYYSRYSSEMLSFAFTESSADARWLRTSQVYKEFLLNLQSEEQPSEKLRARSQGILERVASHYGYYNVMIYNKDGIIVANAKNDPNVNGASVEIAANNAATYRNGGIAISAFEETPFYENKQAFIYYSPIEQEGRILGGLALVINTEIFSNILQVSLPRNSEILSENSEIFGVIFDSNKKIYASTNENFSFSEYPIEEKYDLKNLKDVREIIKLGDKHFVISSNIVGGNDIFRISEYTKSNIYCVIFVAVKDDSMIEEDLPESPQADSPKNDSLTTR